MKETRHRLEENSLDKFWKYSWYTQILDHMKIILQFKDKNKQFCLMSSLEQALDKGDL